MTGDGETLRRLTAVATGRVQNVGFREFVRHEAVSRDITGYVRNSDDGRRVELVAEGDVTQLAALLDAVRTGPRFAHVGHVEYSYNDASGGFARFSVEL